MKTSVSEAKNALEKRNKEMAMSENALKKQAIEMDALKAKIIKLEKVREIVSC